MCSVCLIFHNRARPAIIHIQINIQIYLYVYYRICRYIENKLVVSISKAFYGSSSVQLYFCIYLFFSAQLYDYIRHPMWFSSVDKYIFDRKIINCRFVHENIYICMFDCICIYRTILYFNTYTSYM